jgi:ribosomal protein S27AE
MLLPKLVYALAFSWNYGFLKRKCPDCGHFLSEHQKRADGSFKD